MVSKEELLVMASQFRDAIIIAQNNKEFEKDDVMCHFPNDCCNDVVDLLGEHLLRNGYEDLGYVSGVVCSDIDEDLSSQNDKTHACISVGHPFDSGSIIVDILSDIYIEANGTVGAPEVYVGPMDEFHRSFRTEGNAYYQFRGLQQYSESQYRLIDLYNRILKWI